MMFAKRLREGVREGRITSSVRIWERPRVKPGGVYRMEDGHVAVAAGQELNHESGRADMSGMRSARPAETGSCATQDTAPGHEPKALVERLDDDVDLCLAVRSADEIGVELGHIDARATHEIGERDVRPDVRT
jgi:hypothetical protein